ncbi:haloacid dehalogenase [Aliarcobacter trophiarum LMG 25534]|uniref:phosphoglycolate phosphatase n=1 Tax=Aliarcobacter trophiarum LMG 25534 TaxID=1032241 RepID=A0AAD0VMB7_9BACT|nr:HAD hydrolase-like protein [Aliarcobacter trophiarum]AXK49278.1 HAD superfamily hydrolase, probable phosphatase [Aliarcobacter trophiarum LMG 25534]RXJ91442.1 haloacid dehalogenase [Aliarcobacter trophiarum LMG 25534]
MIKNIIFDFDGVILDSVPIKTEGFKKLFEGFPKNKVKEFIQYHELNGGKSRYIKIKYFFNKLLNENISEDDILKYANRYSLITKEELTNSKYIIEDTVSFINHNYKKYNMHIASGADENDLKYICERLNLTKYFLSITGSPIMKSKIVKNILEMNNYKKEETILIGDSINDYEAAEENHIEFFGYNNVKLKKNNTYIDKFVEINLQSY